MTSTFTILILLNLSFIGLLLEAAENTKIKN
jgi:hypothetical protein